jgi:hypothetical protein
MAPLDKRHHVNGANSERGQALLEMVFVTIFLLTLTFGAIDVGRAIWQKEVITGLTREGSNLASRSTPLALSQTDVISDGAVLNLASSGCVIITAVENQSGNFVIMEQTPICPGYTSKIGTGIGNTAILPSETPVIPAPSTTLYVTEVFSPYSPITPLGAFVNYTLPSMLYDVAYF